VRRWFDADVPAGEEPDVADARVDFFYTASGREREVRRYSDLNATDLVGRTLRTYDLAGRSDQLNHVNAVDEVLSGYDYDYDFSGLLVAETRTHQDPQYAQDIEYKYDRTGQLVEALFSGQDNEFYEYDLNGNRKTATVGDQTNIYAPPGLANQLTSDGTHDYEHDGEGNLIKRIHRTTKETRIFHYDHRNRQVQIDDWSGDAESIAGDVTSPILLQSIKYRFDAVGRRVAREVYSNETENVNLGHFAYDGDNTWLETGDAMVAISRHLFYLGLDYIIATYSNDAKTVWSHRDSVNTVTMFTNPQGAILRSVMYTSYGVPHTNFSAIWQRFGFTGREIEPLTGDYYYRTRTYSPGVGAFLSKDSLGFFAGDLNLHRYVFNAPASGVDPTGQLSLVENAILIGGISGFFLAPTFDVYCNFKLGRTGDITVQRFVQKSVFGAAIGAATAGTLAKASLVIGGYLFSANAPMWIVNIPLGVTMGSQKLIKPPVVGILMVNYKIYNIHNCDFLEFFAGGF